MNQQLTKEDLINMPTNYTPSQVYDKYVALQKQLATNITNTGVAASQTELYDNLIDKVAQIENLKGEERTLENFTNALSEPKSVVQLKYPEPKNLFSLANRAWADFGATPNTTVRNINKDNFYFQVSSNNYVNNSKTGYEIVNGNTIKITKVQHAYGLGVPFHLIAGQQYTISCIRDNEKSRIRVSYYDVNGNYLSEFIDLPGSFTVPENAYWTMILFIAYNPVGASSGELTFSNIQLELGTTATPYEPYPAPKILNAKLGSKNLIPYPYAETRDTIYGISIAYGEDGSIIFNGTAIGNVYFKVFERLKFPAGEYYLSGTPAEGGSKVAFLYFFETDNPNKTYNAYTTNGVSCSLSGTEYSGRIYIANGQTVENLVFKPQIELGSTATSYTPYISDFSTVNVTRCGKNLFIPNSECTPGRGLTCTYDSSNNVFTINGTLTAAGNINIGSILINKEAVYTVSRYYINGNVTPADGYQNLFSLFVKNTSSKYAYPRLRQTSENIILPIISQPVVTIPQSGEYDVLIQTFGIGTVFNNYKFKIQIEIGETTTDFEPYIATEYTPAADGTVSGVTSLYPVTTLLTNNAGVVFEQVTGGTYKEILPSTDKNGITKVYQPSVDSTIDSNIISDNIKQGVSILGVTGNYICNYTYDETTKELVLIL